MAIERHLRPATFAFPVRPTLLCRDVLIIENLTNLGPIANQRPTVYAFPLRICGADGEQPRAVTESGVQCLAQVEQLFAAGFDEITIRPYALPGQSRAAVIEAFARLVMEPYRERQGQVQPASVADLPR